MKINNPFNYKALSVLIAEKRAQEGISFKEMANITKVSASSCHRAEALLGKLDIESMINLCNWVGKPVQYFLIPIKKQNGNKSKNKNR